MTTERPARLDWFKSSHSSGEGGACVEIAADATSIHVRDSKERGGPRLAFTRTAWSGFVAGLEREPA
jgi:hypothetical protein